MQKLMQRLSIWFFRKTFNLTNSSYKAEYKKTFKI